MTENNSKQKSLKRTIFKILGFIFLFFLIITTVGVFVINDKLPDLLFVYGQKKFEAKDYAKSAQIFELAQTLKPNEKKFAYYRVLSLSKLPLTYDNQKMLFDIATQDNNSAAEYLATQILLNFKEKVLTKAGPNYISDAVDNNVIRWDLKSMPLKFYINKSLPTPPYYSELIRSSFKDWEMKTEKTVRFEEVDQVHKADIIVSFINTVDKKEPLRHGQYYSTATTEPSIEENHLKLMHIELQVKNSIGEHLTRNEVKTVMLHEIGHALGLWGHSKDPENIMYYSVEKLFGYIDKIQLNIDDINTLKLLYRLNPDISNTRETGKIKQSYIYAPIIFQSFQNDYSAKLAQTLAELDKNPKDVHKLIELATLYGQIGEYQRSIYVLEKALYLVKDKHNLSIILHNMCANYMNLEQYEKALQFAQIILKLQNDLETKNLILFLNYKLGNTKEAEEEWINLIRKNPNDLGTSLGLANLYVAEKKYLKARQVLKDFIDNNPNSINDPQLKEYKVFLMI